MGCQHCVFGECRRKLIKDYLTNNQIHDYFSILDPYSREQSSDGWAGIERCKLLARHIKTRRAPPWPSPPTSELPSRSISDALVHQYLQKTESLYRILHIPTFRRKYEELWVPGKARDISFLIQLKLVLAIGAVTYDDQFSLRSSAIRWVYEAQIWISGPKYKARLNIQAMQTNLLLLFAQEQVGVSGDLPWVSAGALLRKAIYMGLHRDPSHLPQTTLFEAEMHRRIWNTILEVNVQSSLTSGGPALISLDDFDTSPPRNFDDDQLEVHNPISSSSEEMTQASFAIALRRTFPRRLAVVKFLNDVGSSGTYKETLQLDAELRTAYRELGRTLRACKKSTGSSSSSHYETKAIDFLMHRYFCALHIAYFGPALRGTTYAYSQKSVVESSLKLWRTAWPASTTQASDTSSSNDSDFPRLIACSSGSYPSATIHAAAIIALELRSQLQEDSICPAPLRPDLLSVLQEAKQWCLRVMEAGETSVMGYLLISLIAADVQGIMAGFGEDKIPELLVKAVEEVGQKCLPILEQMAAVQDQSTEVAAELHRAMPTDITEEWDFMVSIIAVLQVFVLVLMGTLGL